VVLWSSNLIEGLTRRLPLNEPVFSRQLQVATAKRRCFVLSNLDDAYCRTTTIQLTHAGSHHPLTRAFNQPTSRPLNRPVSLQSFGWNSSTRFGANSRQLPRRANGMRRSSTQLSFEGSFINKRVHVVVSLYGLVHAIALLLNTEFVSKVDHN
jgi:hypothetical protein